MLNQVAQILYLVLAGVLSISLFVWMLSNVISVLFGAPAISSPANMGWKKFAGKDKAFLDLGCGGGAVLVRAAPHFEHVYGIEASPAYYLLSRWRTRKLDNVTVLFGNFFAVDWPKVDYIYCYLLERPMRQLRGKLVKVDTTVFSLLFPIPEWEVSEVVRDANRNMYVYYPPLARNKK